MLRTDNLMEMIRTWESSSVECKSTRVVSGKVKEPHRDSLSDGLAAFANHQGGTIILGVDESTKQVFGIEAKDVSAVVDYVSEICRDSIEPPLVNFYVDSAQVTSAAGDSRYLVYVEVQRSLWLHKSKNGYFYRHGSSKREMSTEQLLRVGQARSQARIILFDEQAVPGTDQESLSKDLYMRFTREDRTSALIKRRLLVAQNEGTYASVAGVLMCTRSPHQFLSNSFIQAVRYRGKLRDANYQVDAKEFRGPLDSQILEAYRFVDRYNRTSATKGVGRVDHREYSVRAVFEALVNAVVHRDYSIHGSKIRLFMYADRLEIISPGLLPSTLTVENISENQFTRNELLARLLSECSIDDPIKTNVTRTYFLERRGEGVGIILRESEELSGKSPVYEQIDSELKLTIYAAAPPHTQGDGNGRAEEK